jgi:peroxiredoxin family protein
MASQNLAVPDAGTDTSLESRVAALTARLAEVEAKLPEDRVAIVVFSGDLDRVLAGFILATGAAAMGQQVTMFFTFWGYGALRRQKRLAGKTLAQKMMAVMSPSDSRSLPVSRMNYFGVGARMLRGMMREKNVASLEDLMAMARDLGVQIVACEMSRDVMGIEDDELVSGLEAGGAAAFLGQALRSRVTLFI